MPVVRLRVEDGEPFHATDVHGVMGQGFGLCRIGEHVAEHERADGGQPFGAGQKDDGDPVRLRLHGCRGGLISQDGADDQLGPFGCQLAHLGRGGGGIALGVADQDLGLVPERQLEALQGGDAVSREALGRLGQEQPDPPRCYRGWLREALPGRRGPGVQRARWALDPKLPPERPPLGDRRGGPAAGRA